MRVYCNNQPKFRSIAAVGMLASIIGGVVAVSVGIFVGVKRAIVISVPSMSDLGFFTSLAHYRFLAWVWLGLALLMVAHILRRVVLNGLQE